MSSQRGNISRTRKQKHTNSTAYKNNLHGETPKTKILNNIQVIVYPLVFSLWLTLFFIMQICNVCAHCRDILEWKIKFNKYKMLTAPSKCTKCLQKTVKQAYTILCQACAEKIEVIINSLKIVIMELSVHKIFTGMCKVWEERRNSC